jgi:serine/threonine-protein phosphatase 2A regulatory subunit B
MHESREGREPDDFLDWRFVKSFGDDNSSDDDLITALEFDSTGNYLAVGDKAGRICIFDGTIDQKNKVEYKFYTEFQSHEPEFDCLKSLEIEEKINMIKWHKQHNNGLFLLATNDKTIKLWKVHDKRIKRPTRTPLHEGFLLPKLTHYQTITTATKKRVFSNAHNYHINSISINSDGETFLSADDLRVNLWNLSVFSETLNVVDVKPSNLEELTEVITSASFHPIHCHLFVYSTSKGSIRLGDLRESARCDSHSKQFEMEEDPAAKSFYSEIISSVSDAKFVADGRYILARDYLTLKLWDTNMESRPVSIIPVHDYLKTHLADLYSHDCIFDKFECAAASDGKRFITGSYNNSFILHNVESKDTLTIEALQDPPARKSKVTAKLRSKAKKPRRSDVNVQLIDFGKKALHVAWHPKAELVAVAGLNKLYLYNNMKSL